MLLAVLSLLSIAFPLFAQTTVGTGNVVGTVSDPSGAVVSGAKVTIANLATGQLIYLTTNPSGSFNSGALIPGNYKTLVSAKGFSSAEAAVTVQVGNTSTVNVKLQIGKEKEVVEVQDSDVRVNTEQSTVQGVLSAGQIGNLPVNGRNFMDLAQLEPGVQIQDGADLGRTAILPSPSADVSAALPALRSMESTSRTKYSGPQPWTFRQRHSGIPVEPVERSTPLFLALQGLEKRVTNRIK